MTPNIVADCHGHEGWQGSSDICRLLSLSPAFVTAKHKMLVLPALPLAFDYGSGAHLTS